MSTVTGTITVNDVVTAAFRKSGVQGLGQVMDGGDVLDAQNDLADMLAQWNVKTWLVWDKIELSFQSDGRSTPYTVGPGGNYNVTPRPDRIEKAFLRILNTSGQPVDEPLQQMPAYEDYANIALKKLVAFPKSYFYQTQSPLGNLFIYPWPQASLYETHIIVKNAFPLTLPLNTSFAGLPPAAIPAMKFNLARRLRQAYGKGLRPDPELNFLADDALETLRNSQVQVPQLVMPSILLRPSFYNIYSDQTY